MSYLDETYIIKKNETQKGIVINWIVEYRGATCFIGSFEACKEYCGIHDFVF